MTSSLAIFSGLGPVEFVALVILGILLYGKNLPTVARTLGRTIGEFKRQMREVVRRVGADWFGRQMLIRQRGPFDPQQFRSAAGPPGPRRPPHRRGGSATPVYPAQGVLR